MADLATVLDVETEIESVFYNYFSAELGIDPVVSDSNTVLQTPRLEIVATLQEQGPHQQQIPSGDYAGRRIYDFYRVSITIDAVYSPDWPQNPGNLRGKVRTALTDYNGIQTELNVNGYLLLASDSFRQTAGSRTIDEESKTERISTTVEAIFQINPGALVGAEGVVYIRQLQLYYRDDNGDLIPVSATNPLPID